VIIDHLLRTTAASAVAHLAKAIISVPSTFASCLIRAHHCLYRSLRAGDASTMTRSTRTFAQIAAAAASSLIRAGNGLDVALGAVLAGACALGAWADSGIRATVADRSLDAFDFVHIHPSICRHIRNCELVS
jgi:hypothetical protein